MNGGERVGRLLIWGTESESKRENRVHEKKALPTWIRKIKN